MSYQQFVISDVNPNDNAGGGGCACDPRKQIDCKGPYVVCHSNAMEDPLSPHVVIGCACVDAMHKALHEGEALSVGEANTIPATAQPEPSPESQTRRAVVVESPDPENDFDDEAPQI